MAFRSQSVLAMMGAAFCYVYVYTFFQTWFHTFLVRGRGFSEGSLMLSALPYAVAACANVAGGVASDCSGPPTRSKVGRRLLGIVGLGSAGLLTIGDVDAATTVDGRAALARLWSITFQQSGVFGVCLDIGRKHAGSMVGLMNMSAQVGGLLSSSGVRLYRRAVQQL